MNRRQLLGRFLIRNNMTQEERLQEIEHAKDFLIDIIPHNTPNFMEVLQETAEAYVDSMTEQN